MTHAALKPNGGDAGVQVELWSERSRMSDKSEKRPVKQPPRYATWCALCDQEFTPTKSDARFCSASCKAEAHRIVGILKVGGARSYRSLAYRLERAGHADLSGPGARRGARLDRRAAAGEIMKLMRHLGDGRFDFGDGSTFKPSGGIAATFASAAREDVTPGQERDVRRHRQALDMLSPSELEEAAAYRDANAARVERDTAPTDFDRRAAGDRLIDAELRAARLRAHNSGA